MGDPGQSSRHDHSSSVYYQRRTDSRVSSPCMPTPETSRNSDTSLDENFPRPFVRRSAPIHALLSKVEPDNDRPFDRIDSRYAMDSMAQVGDAGRCAPYSPPYRHDSDHRPSLPSLKTLLAVPLSSPPNTPRLHEKPFQPAPREPAYVASTFKPTAFYPNKRPRTEMSPRRSPIFDPRSNVASPRSSHNNFQRRLSHRPDEQGSPNRIWSDERPKAPREVIDSRSQSTHHSYGVQVPVLDRSHPLEPRRSSTLGNADLRSPARTHGYYPEGDPSRSSYQAFRQHQDKNYPDITAPAPFRSMLERSVHDSMAERDPRLRDGPRAAGREHGTHVEMAAGFAGNPYADRQAAFFMPSHYDYQQGKTRKRSNLPKQSTEIMKTWFDQNISNPYPSEEQKQIFSNATGISMTQVSNWFINHRRRCPELRDKRDRSRINGGEMSD